MNQAFENFISDTDDPYNFVAFAADKLDGAVPYLSQVYSSEVQLIMAISTVLSVLGIAYMTYQLSNTTKKHRKLHLHEFAGFEHKENE